jgi:hypothetical protein
MLELKYQQMLMDAVDPERIASKNYVAVNSRLEEAIEFVKKQCPEKFHSEDSIRNRTFYDEPAAHKAPVHHSGFFRQLPKVNRY